MPCNMLIPFADSVNHMNVQSYFSMFHKDPELGPKTKEKVTPVEPEAGPMPPNGDLIWEIYDYQTASEEDDNDSDEPDEDNYDWYTTEDPDIFFSLTSSALTFEAGDQIFIKYGSRSNRYLLLWYGFCLDENKYNVFHFEYKETLVKLRLEKFCKDLIDRVRRIFFWLSTLRQIKMLLNSLRMTRSPPTSDGKRQNARASKCES
jgi:hypothetical protein